MKTRIITGILGLPIVMSILYFGGIYLNISLCIVSIIGMKEFYKAISKKHMPVHYIGYIFTLIYYITIYKYGILFIGEILALFMLVLLMYLVIFNKSTSIENMMATYFGFVYVAVMFSFIQIVRELNDGIFYSYLIFICAWVSDTFAYFIGVFFGKHKLIPKLSPKKTIEGSLGGIVGTILFITVFSYIFMNKKDIVELIFIGFFGSIFSQTGDLAASAIKRQREVKDYGNLIPGHGGILDRCDSILFTAPVIYIVVNISQKFF